MVVANFASIYVANTVLILIEVLKSYCKYMVLCSICSHYEKFNLCLFFVLKDFACAKMSYY